VWAKDVAPTGRLMRAKDVGPTGQPMRAKDVAAWLT
jgi:hypothetical protein